MGVVPTPLPSKPDGKAGSMVTGRSFGRVAATGTARKRAASKGRSAPTTAPAAPASAVSASTAAKQPGLRVAKGRKAPRPKAAKTAIKTVAKEAPAKRADQGKPPPPPPPKDGGEKEAPIQEGGFTVQLSKKARQKAAKEEKAKTAKP
ncbi:PREDICTED: atherin-like [Trachymyrmex cornetzi]|uniref:atherin-like n=1 Tax=Trachymyrmex cornetzi TaxID=471704 RepID=UPI00084EEAE6|nr:PREDICTED: atherin-like [Trachymyrmex cornetzi]